MRRQMADLREYLDRQVQRVQTELDLVRAEVRTLQTMLGELLAGLARR